MVAKGYTQGTLSKAIGISESSLSLKLNGVREFSQTEMLAIKTVLELPSCDPYFFVLKVEKTRA